MQRIIQIENFYYNKGYDFAKSIIKLCLLIKCRPKKMFTLEIVIGFSDKDTYFSTF